MASIEADGWFGLWSTSRQRFCRLDLKPECHWWNLARGRQIAMLEGHSLRRGRPELGP